MSRLEDLATVFVRRGFPSFKATEAGEIPVRSVAIVRSGGAARLIADSASVQEAGGISAINDILLTIEGPSIGDFVVVGPEHGAFVPSQQVATIRSGNTELTDPWFVAAWIATPTAQAQLQRLTRGSAIQRITFSDLGKLDVPSAPIGNQRIIGEKFRAFEESLRTHRAIAECLLELQSVDNTSAFDDLLAHSSSDPRH